MRRQLAAVKYGMVWRKPRFMARMASFYARTFIVGVAPLRYVDLAIDYGCNLRCEHCFAEALKRSKHQKLKPHEYGQIAKQSRDLGAIHLSLQGGEATLEPRLAEIICYMRPSLSLFSITTNGTTITDDMARKLRSLGVDQLNVSLDSWIPEEHDKFRGKSGAWQSTVTGIYTAAENGLRVQINVTVSHANLFTPGFRGVLDFAENNKWIVNLVLAAPVGRWEDNAELLLTEDDMRTVRSIVRSSSCIRQDMDSIQLDRGCPAAKEAIYITPYGDVLCCPFIHVSFGNLHDESLKTIRDRMLQYHFLFFHADQCLAAQDQKFIAKYQQARKENPARHLAVFGSSEKARREYPMPPAVKLSGKEVAERYAEWRKRTE